MAYAAGTGDCSPTGNQNCGQVSELPSEEGLALLRSPDGSSWLGPPFRQLDEGQGLPERAKNSTG